MSLSNTETGFITELLISQDINAVFDKQITPKFLSGVSKQAFRFINKFNTEYGYFPSVESFLRKFPEYPLLGDGRECFGTEESLEYWCDELRKKKQHDVLAEAIEKAVESINDKDTEEAVNIVRGAINKIDDELIVVDSISINKSTQSRKDEYIERKNSGGITGLPSFIRLWDVITGGFAKGTLSTYMGYTGLGKTWLEAIFAVLQAQNGCTVDFFTTEMTTKAVARRVDALMCGLNYTDFVRGQLTREKESLYFNYLDSMEGNDKVKLNIIQVKEGVNEIAAQLDKDKPDIAYVDGAYILSDENDEDDWAAMIRVWRALHKLAISRDIPIVTTTQSKDDVGATLKSMSFAKAIANESDVVVVLEQDEQMRNDKEVRLKPLKLREGKLSSNLYLNWDFDEMNYEPIYKEDSNAEPSTSKDAKGVINVDEE